MLWPAVLLTIIRAEHLRNTGQDGWKKLRGPRRRWLTELVGRLIPTLGSKVL